MDSMKKNGGRTPFKDLTNTTSCDQDASNSLPRDIDSKECKRQRDRERWATMSAEQKNEKTKRRREARQRKKGQPSLTEINKDGDLEEDDEWLHRNETYEPYNFERGDLASADSAPSYGDNNSAIQFTNLSTDSMAGGLHEPGNRVNSTSVVKASKNKKSRAAYFKDRSENMTHQ